MVSRFVTASALVLLVFCGPGCSETAAGGEEDPQTRLIDVLRDNYPELYKDIAIHGSTPDDAAILFLVNAGGTYVFRRGTGQSPEVVHHAKFISPSSITRITYERPAFLLWAGDRLELSLGVHP